MIFIFVENLKLQEFRTAQKIVQKNIQKTVQTRVLIKILYAKEMIFVKIEE